MSMLAESKRRRNYVLTPRGKPLYNDDSRFGSKMLQKMGWTKGKGLGAKESGETDFVRINFKSDSGGLGFEQRDDQWTQHQHSFNDLLQSLNGNVGRNDEKEENEEGEILPTVGFGFKTENKGEQTIKVALSGESLEEKSKKSKARVHYKKFTKGKDISQYSEKDLANIFGKKSLEIDINNKMEDDDDSPYNNEGGSQMNSIVDYFKQKMEKLKGNQSILNEDLVPAVVATETINNCQEQEASSSNSIADYFKRKMEKRKSKQKESKIEVVEDAEENMEEHVAKKQKMSKKPAEEDMVEEISETYFPVSKKKSKKKRKISGEPPEERGGDLTLEKQNDYQTTKTLSTPLPPHEEPDHHLDLVSVTMSKKMKMKTKTEDEEEKSGYMKEEKENPDFYSYTISAYGAEIFRNFDFKSFRGCNLAEINGYSFDKDMKLNIKKGLKDEQRITYLFSGVESKYGSKQKTVSKPTNTSNKTTNTVKSTTIQKPKKRPFYKRHKRHSAFKIAI